MIIIGDSGEEITLEIPWGADFVAAFIASVAWPDGMTIELQLSNGPGDTPVVWPAVITGVRADFYVPMADVQTVINANLAIARLYYTPAGQGPLFWGSGVIKVV